MAVLLENFLTASNDMEAEEVRAGPSPINIRLPTHPPTHPSIDKYSKGEVPDRPKRHARQAGRDLVREGDGGREGGREAGREMEGGREGGRES